MESFYKNWLKTDGARKRQRTGDSTQHSDGQGQSQQPIKDPSDIVYENESLRLKVQKGNFKRQRLFRLQDHLFKFKVVQKTTQADLPLLTELFDFLHAALMHVLESIKTFYKPEDHNIAYLTLHQEPMVNGLNTG